MKPRATSAYWRTPASPQGEEKNDPEFTQQLAELGDIFVNDAFSADHRAHASTEGLTHHLPSVPRPLMMEEINALKSALEVPKRPTAAVVGGAKVSTRDSDPHQPRRQGRQADHRRRNGQHIPAIPGRPGRAVARRTRLPLHRTRDHGRSQIARVPNHPPTRCRHRAQRCQGGCRDRNGRHPQACRSMR